MKIRRISDLDFDEVVMLWHAAKKRAYTYLPREQAQTLPEDKDFFREHILGHCDVWIAEADGRILGFLAICGSYVDRLYVLPETQRRAVGSALIEHAKALSPEGLELYTHQKNAAARAFYEKHGFRAVKLGSSPPPESEPDVEYHWRPSA